MFPECLATGIVRGPDHDYPMRDEYEMSTANRLEHLGAERVYKFHPHC